MRADRGELGSVQEPHEESEYEDEDEQGAPAAAGAGDSSVYAWQAGWQVREHS